MGFEQTLAYGDFLSEKDTPGAGSPLMVENAGNLTTIPTTQVYQPTRQCRTRMEPPPPSASNRTKPWPPPPRGTPLRASSFSGRRCYASHNRQFMNPDLRADQPPHQTRSGRRRGGLLGGLPEDSKSGELARGPVGPHPVPLPHRTRTAGKPGPGAGVAQEVERVGW